jgi:probable phosphoglycerate mutase
MIVLVRHGETASNAARIVQVAETPLNHRGVAQATRLARRLATIGIEHVLCSDLPRAMMTAAPLVEATGVRIEYTLLLQERNFGDLRGRPYAELGRDMFAPDYEPPNGESWAAFHARVDRAWQSVVARASELRGNLAVITHGLVCASIATRRLGLPAGTSAPERWGNTSVTTCDPAPPHAVHVLNCTQHLSGDDDVSAPSGL